MLNRTVPVLAGLASAAALVAACTPVTSFQGFQAIDARLQIDALQHLRIRVPQSQGKLLAQIEARAHVLKRSYRDSKVQMDVEAPESLARRHRGRERMDDCRQCRLPRRDGEMVEHG